MGKGVNLSRIARYIGYIILGAVVLWGLLIWLALLLALQGGGYHD